MNLLIKTAYRHAAMVWMVTVKSIILYQSKWYSETENYSFTFF